MTLMSALQLFYRNMWCKRVYVFLLMFFQNNCNCEDVGDVTTTETTFEDSSGIAPENYIVESGASLESLISSYIEAGPTEAFNSIDNITEIIPTVRVTLFDNSFDTITTTEYKRVLALDNVIETTTVTDINNAVLTATETIKHGYDNIEPISTEAQIQENTIEETLETTTDSEIYYEEITPTLTKSTPTKKKLSEQILQLLEDFKKGNSEGIPGVEIPDPFPVPDEKHQVTFFDTLYLTNSAVYGFSSLHLLYINANFEKLEVNAAMIVDRLETRGNYFLSSFLMPRLGSYTVNITGLKITPSASLGIEIDGKLQMKDIHIDLTLMSNETSIKVEFKNLGSVLQDFINSAGNSIFEQMKPKILSQTYTKIRDDVDKALRDFTEDVEFPNTIPPLDMVLVDIRRKVKELKMDPYHLDDYKNKDNMSFLTVGLSKSWLTGLSTFHRLGNATLRLENNTVTGDVEIATQKLEGFTRWDVSAGGMLSLAGTASFSVEYISLRIKIAQSLDIRERPVLKDIHFDVGNIQARCNGAGTLDYIVELGVNILPNLLRYQIIDSLEGPLKSKLQEELNAVDVEEEIKRASPKIDEMAEQGFKLSFLLSKIDRYDEDDFFNF